MPLKTSFENTYLWACVYVIVYLELVNIIYIFRKFCFRQRSYYSNKRIKFTEVLLDILRTIFLKLHGAYIMFVFWYQEAKWYLNIIAFEILSISRGLFYFVLLYHVREVLRKSFSRKTWVTPGSFLILPLVYCVITVIVREDIHYWQKNPKIMALTMVLWLCSNTIYDIMATLLFNDTLSKYDLGHGRRPKLVRTYNLVRKDTAEPLLEGKDGFRGVSLNSCKEGLQYTEKQGISLDFLTCYHRCVKRNIYSAVIGNILYLQYVIAAIIVFLCIPTDSLIKYWYDGPAVVHYTVTYFAIYICVVLSNRDWKHIFLPGVCKTISSDSSLSQRSDDLLEDSTTNSTIQ
jgi:hypothetical protein